ncbi:MAG: hypothetical protein M5R36_19835 [Deltaproteobacteria bacterium]|nr:hypothetical protein [Deltaproteobacteria bacterium]
MRRSGKIVEFFSNRDDWEETAIFVVEDDPQSGTDHVDPHRIPALVISPWAKRGHVSSVLNSQANVWSTIEHLLGVPPMTKYDEYASPMYDAFTTTADTTPYEALPNPIEFEINPAGLPFQAYCEAADFTTPDAVPRLGEVLWALTRPGEPFPHHLSGADEEDEEEEREEAEFYRDQLAKALDYARRHGLEVRGYDLKP